jgi:hypothetical protein
VQARVIGDGLAVQSMLLISGSQTMRLSFKPELNLAPLTDAAGVEVSFQIDQGKVERVAHGVIILDRQGEALRLRWRFKEPNWARMRALETTIRLTIATNTIGYTIESAQSIDDR